jgi:hypothetical protein
MTPRRSRGRAPRLAAGAVAALVSILAAVPAAAVAAAGAGDGDIDALVDELARLPPDALRRDPAQWDQVLDLLQQYVDAAPPSAGRASVATPREGPSIDERFLADFRALLRGPAPDPKAGLATRIFDAGASSGTAPPPSAQPIEQVVRDGGIALPSSARIALIVQQAGAANAGKPSGAAMDADLRDALDRLQRRASEQLDDLRALQRLGQAAGARRAELDALAVRCVAARSGDDATRLARISDLREAFAAFQQRQNEEAPMDALQDMVGARWQVVDADLPPRFHQLRSALERGIAGSRQAVDDASGDVETAATDKARYQLYLRALDAWAREGAIRLTAIRQGERAREQLADAVSEMRRIDAAASRSLAR